MAATNDAARELRWKLTGIQAEKAQTQEYLNFLNQQEQTIQQQLLNGTTQAATPRNASRGRGGARTAGPKNAGVPKRRRTISPEQRQKMSQAAKNRWAQRKGGDQTTGTGSAPAANVPVPQPPAGMQETAGTVQ